MQPIAYTAEEFQHSLSAKLAAMRKIRRDPVDAKGTFEQRLALANDRIALQRNREDAAERRGVPMNALTVGRFDDSGPRSNDYPPSGFTAADDRYGAGGSDEVNSAPDGRHEDSAGPGDQSNAPHEPTEAEVEMASQRRLLEANQRQASSEWVVLDRITALNRLLSHPEGLSLTQLAQQLMGDKASPRDTRRLSAMMKREETRETINRAGRDQPITLTEEGKRELEVTDIAAAAGKTLVLQQERVKAQSKRLSRKSLAVSPRRRSEV